MNRRSLIVIAAILAAAAVLLAVSGGVRATVGGFRISARSPIGASAAAVMAAASWWLLARRAKAVRADLESAWFTLDRHHAAAIIVVALLSAGAAAIFATHSASGADASGYLSQSLMWQGRGFFHVDELSRTLATSDRWITAPLGWRPTEIPGMQAPTYPPGLPWLMALVPGTSHAGWIVVLSTAIAVWATGMVATRLAGGIAGIAAAMLIAISPVFLFQSVQPMSDVPVTAAWMLSWLWVLKARDQGSGIRDQGSGTARGDKPSGLSIAAGIACALAILIRPNLAPLAAVPLLAIGLNVRRLAAFSLPVTLAGLSLMWLQWQWYGSPFRSGYGTADELFAVTNIGANAARYWSWLVDTSPLLLIAPLGIVLMWRQAATRALALFAALVVAAYLVYAVFDVWSYLRFLLPAMAVAAVLAGVAIAAALRRLPASVRLAGALVLTLGVFAHGIAQARALDTFRLADQQRRVAQVAEFISTTLPQETVIVSGEQSGSLRYYTGRSILRWDTASPVALAAALSTLSSAGRPIVIALDAWENEPFRARLGALPAVSLEWPAAFEAGTSHRTRVWRLSDRDAFLRGEHVATQRLP